MKEEAVKQGLKKECDVDRQRGSDRHFVCVWELLSLLFRSSNICLPFYSLYLPDKGEGLWAVLSQVKPGPAELTASEGG